MLRQLGEVGQWAGMAASIAGLVIEIVTRADVGYIILTIGSLAWGIGTKVKYYRRAKGERGAAYYRLR